MPPTISKNGKSLSHHTLRQGRPGGVIRRRQGKEKTDPKNTIQFFSSKKAVSGQMQPSVTINQKGEQKRRTHWKGDVPPLLGKRKKKLSHLNKNPPVLQLQQVSKKQNSTQRKGIKQRKPHLKRAPTVEKTHRKRAASQKRTPEKRGEHQNFEECPAHHQ